MEKLNAIANEILTLFNIDLSSFTTQVTTQGSLSDEMKIFYSDYLIDNAQALLVHDQFGQKQPIPKNGGKTIEFRKYAPLKKALTPLTEGVTPGGNSLSVSVITASVKQYGDFIELSDMLMLTAIDNNLVQASKLLGVQAGETLDTVTREVINAGTNVQFCKGTVTSRYQLVGGDATAANNHYLGVDCMRRARRGLKVNKAKPINGYYIAIIHPDVTYDFTGDPKWEAVKTYSDSTDLYEGEIGRMHGFRFVETTEAKIFTAKDLSVANRNLKFASATDQVVTVQEALTAGDATALVGRNVIIKGYKYTVTAAAAGSAGAATITVGSALQGTPTNGEVVYPGEAGAKGRAVYSTLCLGENAYGVTEITGGGLEMIVKQLGSAGTSDALNQRATSGWKATKTAELLVPEYLLRIETASEFDGAEN